MEELKEFLEQKLATTEYSHLKLTDDENTRNAILEGLLHNQKGVGNYGCPCMVKFTPCICSSAKSLSINDPKRTKCHCGLFTIKEEK